MNTVIVNIVALIFLSVVPLTAAGQTERKPFSIDVDYGRFFGNDTLVYVELYYSFPENSVTYKLSNDRYVGGANIYAVIREAGTIVRQQDWTAPHTIADTSQILSGRNIVGLTSFALPVGEYECEVRSYDFYNPVRADTVVFPLVIQNFPTNRVSVSDIELSTSIRQTERDSNNVFYKNTLEVIPNVSSVFGNTLTRVYYYLEAYNLNLLPVEQYIAHIVVVDAGGKEVFHQRRTKRRVGNSSVEVGMFDVGAFGGGTYTMKFSLLDTTTNVAYSSSKKFFIYKPGETVPITSSTDVQVTESEFAIMEEPELNEDFRWAQYISSESELKEFNALSQISDDKRRLDAKRRFLFNFWQKRSGTAGGFSRKDYLKRVEDANQRFSGSFRKGWQTDRGRVLILYGEPSEIDRYPNTPEYNPYEVWNYHQIQGGVVFVFVDRTGFGDWRLVHSTHRSELRDDNWTRYIQK